MGKSEKRQLARQRYLNTTTQLAFQLYAAYLIYNINSINFLKYRYYLANINELNMNSQSMRK